MQEDADLRLQALQLAVRVQEMNTRAPLHQLHGISPGPAITAPQLTGMAQSLYDFMVPHKASTPTTTRKKST